MIKQRNPNCKKRNPRQIGEICVALQSIHVFAFTSTFYCVDFAFYLRRRLPSEGIVTLDAVCVSAALVSTANVIGRVSYVSYVIKVQYLVSLSSVSGDDGWRLYM